MTASSPGETPQLASAVSSRSGQTEHLASLFGGAGQLEGFRPEGWAAFIAYRDKFTNDLGSSAEAIARARDGSAVDRGDVKAAYRKIMPNSGLDMWSVIFQLSGILAAATVTMAVTRAAVPGDAVPHPDLWNAIEIVASVLAIAGYVAVAVHSGRRGRS
jgi:hypothetical protein